MAGLARNLLILTVCLMNRITHFNTASSVGQRTVVDCIREDPRLKETKKWATESGVLDDLDVGGYAVGISLSLPSNEAVIEFRRKYPELERKLRSSKNQMETLVLFAATDTRVEVSQIKSGALSATNSIVSLLSHYSSISPQGRLCIDDARDEDDEEFPLCGNLDLDNAISATDGNIFLIDTIILPQEILDELHE